MQESVRAYLTAGLSTVAAGAIIATPISPLSPQADSPLPQVRINDLRLDALSTPLAAGGLADRPEAVHLLADVSRGLTTLKAANAASSGRANPLSSSATTARANMKTGVVTAPNPATADTPDSDSREAVGAPHSNAVNTIDAPTIGGILATAVQLALDSTITAQATFIQGTMANLNQVILAVGTLDPNAVKGALQGFVTGEVLTIGVAATTVSADLTSLQEAIDRLGDTGDGGGDVATAFKVAKTIKAAAAPGTDGTGTADEATSNGQRRHVLDAGSSTVGDGSQGGSGGSAHNQDAVGGRDGAVTTDDSSDNKVSGSSDTKSTGVQTDDSSDTDSGTASGSKQNTATATSSSKTNPSDTKSGTVSGSRQNTATATASSKSDASNNKAGATSGPRHALKKGDRSGAQSAGKTGNSGGGKHRKH